MVKIHVTPNLVAPAPALTSSVDYKSEQFLLFLPLFPTIDKLALHLVAEDGLHFYGCSHSGSNRTHDASLGRGGSSCVAGLFSDTCGSPSKPLRFERARKRTGTPSF